MFSTIAASIILRQSASMAFKQKFISLVTPDIIGCLPEVLGKHYQEIKL